MLEHQKLVIRNIAYSKELFRKEICKSLAWLNSQDITQLFSWLIENFRDIHRDIIGDVMHSVQPALCISLNK